MTESEAPSSIVIAANREIKEQLADANVQRALLATTFKGLTVDQMRQAILEGMLRGFTFVDFLKKNVYAIKYGGGYSLVTSIDYARKVGARSGINGKSAPSFTMTTGEDGKPRIESCSVTVFKKGGHPGGYTATVFFDEYYKPGTTWEGVYKPSMWDTKPRTMIAKVAEMHAHRMACPELAQVYLEDEFRAEEQSHSPMEEATVELGDTSLTMGAFERPAHDAETTYETGPDEAAAAGSGEEPPTVGRA